METIEKDWHRIVVELGSFRRGLHWLDLRIREGVTVVMPDTGGSTADAKVMAVLRATADAESYLKASYAEGRKVVAGPKLPQEKYDQAFAMLEAGVPVPLIAEKVGIGRATVFRLKKKLEANGIK